MGPSGLRPDLTIAVTELITSQCGSESWGLALPKYYIAIDYPFICLSIEDTLYVVVLNHYGDCPVGRIDPAK